MEKQEIKDFVKLNNKIFAMVLDINDQLARKESEIKLSYKDENGRLLFGTNADRYQYSENLYDHFYLFSGRNDKGRMYFDDNYVVFHVRDEDEYVDEYNLLIPYEIIEHYEDKEVLTYLIDEKVRNEYKVKFEYYIEREEEKRQAEESKRRILTQTQLEQEIFNELKAKHGDKLLSMLKLLEKGEC